MVLKNKMGEAPQGTFFTYLPLYKKKKWFKWITDPSIKPRPVRSARDNVCDPEFSKDFT